MGSESFQVGEHTKVEWLPGENMEVLDPPHMALHYVHLSHIAVPELYPFITKVI